LINLTPELQQKYRLRAVYKATRLKVDFIVYWTATDR